MIGYLKCPKCHAPMPGASSSRMRRASMAGGTTSERIDLPETSGGGNGLLWIIAVLVLGAGVAVWATQCRAANRNATPAAAVTDENAPVAGTAVAPQAVDETLPAPSQTGNPDPSFAADALEGELAGERLFATVQVLGEVLDVRSAFCAEARLAEIITRHAGELRAAGVVRMRCSETYGTQVFERPL
jgi:hypothetical protein